MAAIQAANGLESPDRLQIGQQLLIPGGRQPSVESSGAVQAPAATERLPVSRTYMPTLFVNIVGRLI